MKKWICVQIFELIIGAKTPASISDEPKKKRWAEAQRRISTLGHD
jgi:hypothetical protein